VAEFIKNSFLAENFSAIFTTVFLSFWNQISDEHRAMSHVLLHTHILSFITHHYLTIFPEASINLKMLADVFRGQTSGKTLRGGKFCTLQCVGGRKTDVAK
jgi:hypothetical protein